MPPKPKQPGLDYQPVVNSMPKVNHSFGALTSFLDGNKMPKVKF